MGHRHQKYINRTQICFLTTNQIFCIGWKINENLLGWATQCEFTFFLNSESIYAESKVCQWIYHWELTVFWLWKVLLQKKPSLLPLKSEVRSRLPYKLFQYTAVFPQCSQRWQSLFLFESRSRDAIPVANRRFLVLGNRKLFNPKPPGYDEMMQCCNL